MTRRYFVGSSLVILVSAAVSPIFATTNQLMDVLRVITHYSRKGISFKSLNAAYLAHFGALDIRADYFDQFYVDGKGLESFVELVQKQIHEDFKQGRIWTYDGWILSKTESEFTLRLHLVRTA